MRESSWKQHRVEKRRCNTASAQTGTRMFICNMNSAYYYYIYKFLWQILWLLFGFILANQVEKSQIFGYRSEVFKHRYIRVSSNICTCLSDSSNFHNIYFSKLLFSKYQINYVFRKMLRRSYQENAKSELFVLRNF